MRAGEDAWEYDEPPRCPHLASSRPDFLDRVFRCAGCVAAWRSVALHAESAKSFYKRGQTAEAREDYDAAFEDYQKAYAMAPNDLTLPHRVSTASASPTSSLHVTKGRKLLQAGDEQGALAEFLRASEIDPGNEAAQQEIARIRARQGSSSRQAAEQPSRSTRRAGRSSTQWLRRSS